MEEIDERGKRGTNWLSFNGEIYNFRKVREKLIKEGWRFRTESDSEVILKAYRAWGPEAVHELDGMFAFALWDEHAQRLFLCRDRMGIKPLYLYQPKQGGLFFASEIRALLALGTPWVERKIDKGALQAYFAQGSVWGNQTLVSGIRALEAGSYTFADRTGKLQPARKYWALRQHAELPPPPTRSECVHKIRQLLQQAMEDHLVSDVPVGLFLSGGIDSSALAILASRAKTGLDAITLGFKQKDYDETHFASRLGKSLGLRHQIIRRSEAELIEDFPRFLSALDQPSIDGFNTYLVSKAAREAGLKVVLSGLGADELFGGYPSFWQVPLALRIRNATQLWRSGSRAFALLARQLPTVHADKLGAVFYRPNHLVDIQILRRELFLRERHPNLPSSESGVCRYSGIEAALVAKMKKDVEGLAPETQISLLELQSYLRYVLLRDSDNFSMAHSLELRVPFLSTQLMEFLISVPGKWKRYSRYPKPLLVDAVDGLPREVYARKKQGFSLPWASWMNGPLKKLFTSLLDMQDLWKTLGIESGFPKSVWQQFQVNPVRIHASRVLALCVLASFAKEHNLSGTD